MKFYIAALVVGTILLSTLIGYSLGSSRKVQITVDLSRPYGEKSVTDIENRIKAFQQALDNFNTSINAGAVRESWEEREAWLISIISILLGLFSLTVLLGLFRSLFEKAQLLKIEAGLSEQKKNSLFMALFRIIYALENKEELYMRGYGMVNDEESFIEYVGRSSENFFSRVKLLNAEEALGEDIEYIYTFIENAIKYGSEKYQMSDKFNRDSKVFDKIFFKAQNGLSSSQYEIFEKSLRDTRKMVVGDKVEF